MQVKDIVCPFNGQRCLTSTQCPFWNYKNDTCILVRACVSVISTNNILRGDKDNDREDRPVTG